MIVKSAITPSLRGLIASIWPGVRPNINFASEPTATTDFDALPPLPALIATTDGSFKIIPLPLTYISVFAVPKSIDKSLEKRPLSILNIRIYLLNLS